MSIWIPGGLSNNGGSSYVPPSWSTGSDEEIIEALEKHYNDEINLTEYWSIGDERVINLSSMRVNDTASSDIMDAQDVVFVLSEVGGKELVTPINGHTECVFQVDQKDLLTAQGYMNSSNTTSGGWDDSARRFWCNNSTSERGYYSAVPSSIRSIFKLFYNESGKGGNVSGGTTTTQDYFALRAEVEVLGTTTYSVEDEGTQITWYETSNNRIKKYYDSINNDWYANTWWLRSPRKKVIQ